MTTPQSTKEAVPGKFPPRVLIHWLPDFKDAPALVYPATEANRCSACRDYLSIEEHESALAEAVRKARESGIIKGLEMALEDGVSRFDSTGVGRIRDMLASARAAALSAPGEEGERNGKE